MDIRSKNSIWQERLYILPHEKWKRFFPALLLSIFLTQCVQRQHSECLKDANYYQNLFSNEAYRGSEQVQDLCIWIIHFLIPSHCEGLGCCPGWDVKGLSHLSQLQRLPDHSELEYLVGTVSLSFSVKCRAMWVCNYTAFSLPRDRGFSSLFSHTSEGQGCLGISAQVSKISPVLPSQFPNVQLLSVCRQMDGLPSCHSVQWFPTTTGVRLFLLFS